VYDLIIVPGGGVTSTGELPLWVSNRFDRALERGGAAPILCLSAASAHKPLPLDSAGKPIFEASAGAKYLLARGIPTERIVLELASYDTIGNAYFARVIHTEVRGWRNLLIVNSAFHMPRTELIFRWVFGLDPDHGYTLEFDTVPDAGMPDDALAFRRSRETAGLERTRALAARIHTLGQLHQFLFTEHDLYSTRGIDVPWEVSPSLEAVY
jgi:hypothetical protein